MSRPVDAKTWDFAPTCKGSTYLVRVYPDKYPAPLAAYVKVFRLGKPYRPGAEQVYWYRQHWSVGAELSSNGDQYARAVEKCWSEIDDLLIKRVAKDRKARELNW
jgi:hypothetical protein